MFVQHNKEKKSWAKRVQLLNKHAESIRWTYSTAPRPASAQTFPTRCWSEPRPPRTAEKGYRTEREKQNEHQINMHKIRAPHTRMTRVLLVISVQTVHQDGQNPRLDQVVNGRVTVTRQQLPARWGQRYFTQVIHVSLVLVVSGISYETLEPSLTWRPERRWAECPGYRWSHSTNMITHLVIWRQTATCFNNHMTWATHALYKPFHQSNIY